MDTGQQRENAVYQDMTRTPRTTTAYRERFQLAQQSSHFPDLSKILGPQLDAFISSHANKINCSEIGFLLPLISCCAGLMGANTSIHVHDGFEEPPILWTLTVARRGTGKTPVYKYFIKALLDLDVENEKQWHLTRPQEAPTSQSPGGVTSKQPKPPKVVAGPTSLPEVFKILEANDGSIITLYEDLKYLHKRLHEDVTDEEFREYLFSLYEGLPHFSSHDGEVSVTAKTCYNHSGFGHPNDIIAFLEHIPSSLHALYLVSCPQESYGRRQTPASAQNQVPNLKTFFQIMNTFHQQSREYVFQVDALTELTRFMDDEWIGLRIQFLEDEHRKLIIDKIPGQIVRLAGILRALSNACLYASQTTSLQTLQWDLNIDRATVSKAILLSRYFIDQKFALLDDSTITMRQLVVNVDGENEMFINRVDSQCGTVEVEGNQTSPGEPQSTSPCDSNVETPRKERASLPETAAMLLSLPDGPPIIPEFMHIPPEQFIKLYCNKIRRLLEFSDDGSGIAASVASQYSIPPTVHIPGMQNKKPTWVAELFFQKVSELGFGMGFYVKQNSTKKMFMRFKRKHPNELTMENLQMLNTLGVNMDLYGVIGNKPPRPAIFDPALLHSLSVMSTYDPNCLVGSSSSRDESGSCPPSVSNSPQIEAAVSVKREYPPAEDDCPSPSKMPYL